jgi:hypothetical protein
MTEMIFSWVADRFTSSDIIDLYFIVSDLVDIPLTEAELCETAYFDSLASHTVEGFKTSKSVNIPIGKLVL